MFALACSHIITYLFWVNPGSDLSRWFLILLLLPIFLKHPLLCSLGIFWQSFSLLPSTYSYSWDFRPLLELRCDEKFWFVCTSNEESSFVRLLMRTRLFEGALALRAFVEARTQAWDPVWGPMAFSLLMGGEVDRDIKNLYRNLGFLHVLVVSGSQFSLLSRLVENLLIKPVSALYALTIIRWKVFRELKFLFDLGLQIFLVTYLLATGATPPCQRAFLVSFSEVLARWYLKPAVSLKTQDIFLWQLLLFPASWFSLSNALSWGAVLCLKLYQEKKTFLSQLRTSSAIQCLNLAFFSRISLSALAFDFFLAPLWDFLLVAALSAIFSQNLAMGGLLSEVLNLIHDTLGKIERWQVEVLGSSSLTFHSLFEKPGRVAAVLIFVGLILPLFSLPKDEGLVKRRLFS